MANPLARVIMNNIAQNSKKVDTRSNYAKNAYTVSGLGPKEEQLLINVINKNANTTVVNSKGLGTLNLSTKQVENNRVNSFNKVKLEDLAQGNIKSSNNNKAVKKSNTMLTLNELAGKIKKSNDSQETSNEYTINQNNKGIKDVYVKTGVINNLEAYIPKVSLDSIGKKGSLL
ncbi:hypothetical protein [Proteiniborus sp.]|uniref:hypothetical protein n=1 Tax=Proteiniborus sp. TaxID=2079015 RepID=UPI0033238808